MIALKFVLSAALLVASCTAFAPPPRHPSVSNQILYSDRKAVDFTESLTEVTDKAKDLVANIREIDVGSVLANTDKIKDNLFEGEFGERGEVYVATQAALVLCILAGGVPVIGDVATLLLGPGLLLAGIGVMALSVTDLGEQLSPWPVPTENGSLKTDGIYSEMRHPLYAGLLYACLGLSMTTGSATRLLLTAALTYSLSIKCDFEEEEMMKKYPEYGEYKDRVSTRFIPDTLLSNLPW